MIDYVRFVSMFSRICSCFQQSINIFSTKIKKIASSTKWNNVEESGILWKKFLLLHLRINFYPQND